MKSKNLKYICLLPLISVAAPLVLTGCKTEPTTYTIFHTNDVHGRLQTSSAKYNEWAGLEKLAEYTKLNAHDLLLDAGDFYQGLPISNLDKGETANKIKQYMEYDFQTIGNHEFDFGIDQLKKLTGLDVTPKENINFLANNIKYKNNNELMFKPHTIGTLHDGTKVGLIGVATPETETKTHPNNVQDVNFINPIEETKKSVEELTQQGVNIIIVLSHLGLDATSEYTSEKLAQQVDGIDIIVDGHSHTELKEGMVIKKENQPNDTYIVQTGSYTINLGKVEFKLSDDKKALKDVNISLIGHKEIGVEANKDVQNIYSPLVKKYQANSNAKAFSLPDDGSIKLISQEGTTALTRQQETNLGNVYADALVFDAQNLLNSKNKEKTTDSITETKIDFAIINGGSFRANIEGTQIGNEKHVVTNEMVDATSPFGNTLEVLELDSKTVWEVFEHSGATWGAGSFLQVSKEVEVTYEKIVNGNGYSVKTLKIGGTEVQKTDTTKKFKVVSNDYLLAGGDGYKMLTGKSTGTQGGILSESFKKYGMELEKNQNNNTATAETKSETTPGTDTTQLPKWENYKEQKPQIRIKGITITTAA